MSYSEFAQVLLALPPEFSQVRPAGAAECLKDALRRAEELDNAFAVNEGDKIITRLEGKVKLSAYFKLSPTTLSSYVQTQLQEMVSTFSVQ